MRNVSWIPLLVLVGAGCEQARPTSLPSRVSVTHTPPDHPLVCVALDDRCDPAGDPCCAGAFCEAGPYTPEAGRCVAQRADGEYCGAAFECTSGQCNAASRCGPLVCSAAGEACGEAGCCAGTYCESNSYLETFGHCTPALPDGEFCTDASECQTGACTNNQCGVPACAPAGAECFGFDAPCCAGLACDIPADSYGPGQCSPQLGLGEPCELDPQCASGRCAENRCAEPGPVEAVTFAEVFEQVLVPNGCTNGYCHGSGAGSLWLSDADGAYRALVGAPPAGPGCEAVARVAPGDLAGSLLWGKVAPDLAAPCGIKMPPARGALSPAATAIVEAWIRGGAPR
jgi:hypothetical protein